MTLGNLIFNKKCYIVAFGFTFAPISTNKFNEIMILIFYSVEKFPKL
jgi:hypothetical protein